MNKTIILFIIGLLICSPCFSARVDVGSGGGGGTVSDVVYGAGWNGDTTVAPSKNAVYDKIETLGSGAGDIEGVTAGAGLSGGGTSGTVTLATDSSEAAFLASGALTCGAGTAGKIQVHTTPIQYCDNAATPALQYAAYGSSTGVATSATALAADPVDCGANTFATTIAANGALTCASIGDADVPNTITIDNATTAANLGADGVDALTEIAQGIKTAANDTSPLVIGTAGSNGEIAKWNTDGTLTDSNVIIGTVTDGKWCSYASTGTLLSCTQDAPAGSGDITDVFSCASGDCSSITMAATDLLNMSGTDASTATEGLILPQHATACAGGTAEGQVCWEADANILHIGDAATIVDFVPTSAFSGDAVVSTTGAVTIQANSVALTTDTSGNYAAGDAEAGAALTGDSATSFFASGTIEDARLPASMADKVITGSLAVPQGASPTVDAVGESAVDTTTDQFVYYGGAKRTLPYSKEICVTLETPVDADDNIMFFQPRHAITITDVVCRVDGGTSIPLTISDGTNALEAITCATTATEDDGSIANGTFTALERMEFDLGAPTGTQTWLNFCVTYTVDAD